MADVDPAPLVLGAAFLLSACGNPARLSRSEIIMDTTCAIAIARGGDERALDEAFVRLRQIDGELSERERTIFLKRKGMAIDLGSGTKGYATDEVVKILRSRGVTRAIIDLGGNIFVMGSKTAGRGWRVGLQDPSGARASYLGVATLVEQDDGDLRRLRALLREGREALPPYLRHADRLSGGQWALVLDHRDR
jgi:hypothetical protein